MNETLGREAPVPGSCAHVEPNPHGLVTVLMAPIAGLCNPDTGMANALDVAVFACALVGAPTFAKQVITAISTGRWR
jgi:hypothetical protein